jgi:hypothetical protein
MSLPEDYGGAAHAPRAPTGATAQWNTAPAHHEPNAGYTAQRKRRQVRRLHFINSAKVTSATDAIAGAKIPTRKNRSFSGIGSADSFRAPTAPLQWNKRFLLSEKGVGNNRQQMERARM